MNGIPSGMAPEQRLLAEDEQSRQAGHLWLVKLFLRAA